jgi:hypothetical protein
MHFLGILDAETLRRQPHAIAELHIEGGCGDGVGQKLKSSEVILNENTLKDAVEFIPLPSRRDFVLRDQWQIFPIKGERNCSFQPDVIRVAKVVRTMRGHHGHPTARLRFN